MRGRGVKKGSNGWPNSLQLRETKNTEQSFATSYAIDDKINSDFGLKKKKKAERPLFSVEKYSSV